MSGATRIVAASPPLSLFVAPQMKHDEITQRIRWLRYKVMLGIVAEYLCIILTISIVIWIAIRYAHL
jgi:hypothetical protein